jgi:protein-tyrosine kinase
MGKVHEAFQKYEEGQNLKVLSKTRPGTNTTKATAEEATLAEPVRQSRRSDVFQIDPNLVVYHDPASMEAEIFKILRNNILFPKEGEPPPSIMVTSAVPGMANPSLPPTLPYPLLMVWPSMCC